MTDKLTEIKERWHIAHLETYNQGHDVYWLICEIEDLRTRLNEVRRLLYNADDHIAHLECMIFNARQEIREGMPDVAERTLTEVLEGK